MHCTIRKYRTEDRESVLACIIYLQDFERALEPDEKMPGQEIAESFLDRLHRENAHNDGALFVAVGENDVVIGFCNAWVEKQPEEECLTHKAWLYVSDLVVLPDYQGVGLGRKLIDAAEDYGRNLGLERMQLGVLARSQNSRAFYNSCGFREFEVTLVKEL